LIDNLNKFLKIEINSVVLLVWLQVIFQQRLIFKYFWCFRFAKMVIMLVELDRQKLN